uniref:Uncharacterized protein n=1 Tax=Quercus lobata TaxID=97700 RepID=A0A7N2REP9_QUELO
MSSSPSTLSLSTNISLSIDHSPSMASESSGRGNPGSKGFDFGSDDILCSYEDYTNQDSSNGKHGDPVISSNSGKLSADQHLQPEIYTAPFTDLQA